MGERRIASRRGALSESTELVLALEPVDEAESSVISESASLDGAAEGGMSR
jgi:hypothetical protein